MEMWAWRVVTSAASVACASSRYWTTRARPASSWAASSRSMVGVFVRVAMALGLPPVGRAKRGAVVPVFERVRWARGPQARRGGDRRPDPVAVQPRQGPVPEGRLHEGPRHRLLHAHRAGRAAAPARAPTDAQALSQRRRGRVLLREAVPAPPARLG